MGYDIGLGFEIETMHIIGLVALIALGVAGFMYFRSRKNTNLHVEFDDNLNKDFPRNQEQDPECDNEKCSIR
jgi:hypothetical protein